MMAKMTLSCLKIQVRKVDMIRAKGLVRVDINRHQTRQRKIVSREVRKSKHYSKNHSDRSMTLSMNWPKENQDGIITKPNTLKLHQSEPNSRLYPLIVRVAIPDKVVRTAARKSLLRTSQMVIIHLPRILIQLMKRIANKPTTNLYRGYSRRRKKLRMRRYASQRTKT